MDESTTHPTEHSHPSETSAAPSPGRGLRIGEAVTQLWEEALLETRARQAHQSLPTREWFSRLPEINRRLLGSGLLCMGLGVFCLAGIPLLSSANSAVQTAFHPYTASGKSETCLSNLQRVAAALAQYRSDYDDKFPPGEYPNGQQRRTWVALLRERGAGSEAFSCPTFGGRSDGQETGAIGFNPVLTGTPGERVVEPGQVLLAADRSSLHDTILLPPFTGWPALYGKQLETRGNIEARHTVETYQPQANRLYVDGHAGSESGRDWIEAAETWGGPLLFQAALQRLEKHNPSLLQLKSSPPKDFASQKSKLRGALEQLRLLEKQSQASSLGNEVIGKRLWKGAGVLRSLGDGQVEQQLTDDLLQVSRDMLGQVGGGWQRHESEDGFAVQHPTSWKAEQEIDGRYRSTYLRSGSPHIFAMIEKGERARPTEATVIDWSGMESSLKKQYGKNYKRIRMGTSTLGGQEVSLWECELKKPDGPKLRKRYLGYSTTWNSYIFVTTAPAGAARDWYNNLERIRSSFELQD